MKIKNKMILILMIGIVLVFSGCSKKSVDKVAEEKVSLNVTTSFYPIYIMTLNITKDVPGVKVMNMTKPITGCLHDYSLTPDDMKTLEKSNVFVINGVDMESFMDKVIGGVPKLKIIDSSKGIEIIKGKGEEGDNPHLWVSISNAIVQVQNIEKELSDIDPNNSKKYKENSDNYISKLSALRDKMHKSLDNVQNRNIITFHEAFPYFAKEFNLNIVGVIEREPGSEPSPKELQESIDMVKELKVNALFIEPQYPAKAAETIARDTGAKVYVLDPGVTGNMDLDGYLNIMEDNLKVLEGALK